MKVFTEITAEDWDAAVRRVSGSGLFMEERWERVVSDGLSFVSFHHFRYHDTHLLRIASINGRLSTVPFSEGSDVLALTDTPLDRAQLQGDLQEQFGTLPRLRINERFAPLSALPDESVAAHEYVVDLTEALLPRVRKTLRHTLSRPIDGRIERTQEQCDIDAAYMLYLRHMRSVRNFAMPKPLFEVLLNLGGGELWVWRRGAAPDAMAIFLPGEEEALYSLSAANSEAIAASAAQHVVYTALKTYQEEGKVRTSLGATGTGSPLEVFKRGWRGESYRVCELGERSFGVGRSSRVRQLAGYVPLSLYPSLTAIAGRYLL